MFLINNKLTNVVVNMYVVSWLLNANKIYLTCYTNETGNANIIISYTLMLFWYTTLIQKAKKPFL